MKLIIGLNPERMEGSTQEVFLEVVGLNCA